MKCGVRKLLNLKDGFNFKQYYSRGTEEQKKAQKLAYENTMLSEDTINVLNNLDSEINVIIFSENYCPDCRVTLPFIEKMQEINNNIKVYIFSRIGNEELMESCTPDPRVPTVMTFDKRMESKGIYIEMPEKVRDMLINSTVLEKRRIIMDYRIGKFNNIIQEQLLQIIK